MGNSDNAKFLSKVESNGIYLLATKNNSVQFLLFYHGILLHHHSPRGTGRHRWVVSSDWPILGPPPTLASSHWVDSDTKAH